MRIIYVTQEQYEKIVRDHRGCGTVMLIIIVVVCVLSSLAEDKGRFTSSVTSKRVPEVPEATAGRSLSPYEQSLAYDDADRRMNVAYKGLSSRLNAREQQKLKGEQIRWLNQLNGVDDPAQRTAIVTRRAQELNTRWMQTHR